MVWRYVGEGATHKNLSLRRTDGQTDACAMTVALLTKSSRANNILEVLLHH